MAARTSPSERHRRLGAELRKLRVNAGMSGDAAGALLDADRTRISHIEAGRMNVPRNGLYTLLRSYGCPEGPFFDGLMAMAQERGNGWWDDYAEVMERRALDLAETESRCQGIRIHEPFFIPGILQTEDYARALILDAKPKARHIDQYVSFRMARQRILQADSAVSYHAVIHESALRVRIGSERVMRRQLLRLIEAARLPHLTFQIFPFEMGGFSGFCRPFMLLSGPTPQLDTLYLEHPQSTVFTGDGDRIAEYARMFERLRSVALAPVVPTVPPESQEARNSLSLIQHALHELR